MEGKGDCERGKSRREEGKEGEQSVFVSVCVKE